MKGADLITEYLVRQRDPLRLRNLRARQCRHARFALPGARPHQDGLAAPRAGRGAHGGRLFPRPHEPVATLTSCGPGSCNIVMPLAVRAVGFLGGVRDHRQCADLAVQPQPVPGDQQAPPGRFPEHHPAGSEAQLPADARRHAAAGAAPGDDDDAVGPSGAGQPRRALQRLPGGGRRRACRRPRPAVNAQRSGASPERLRPRWT